MESMACILHFACSDETSLTIYFARNFINCNKDANMFFISVAVNEIIIVHYFCNLQEPARVRLLSCLFLIMYNIVVIITESNQ